MFLLDLEVGYGRVGHGDVTPQRPVAGRPLYGAVFDSLPAGEYTLWRDDRPLRRHVAVAGAVVTHLEIKEEHA